MLEQLTTEKIKKGNVRTPTADTINTNVQKQTNLYNIQDRLTLKKVGPVVAQVNILHMPS